MKSRHPAAWAYFALLLATLIWGASFVMMKQALMYVDTYYLLAIRFGSAALILGALFHHRLLRCQNAGLWQSLLCGVFLFVAYAFQTEGLKGTTPGKNAFLTAVDCILVPFLVWFVYGRRPTIFNLLAGLFGLCGIGCISLDARLTIGTGDLLTILGGFFFAVHIIAVAKLSAKYDILALTAVQFTAVGVLSFLFALMFNRPPRVLGFDTAFSLVYLCLFATAVAFLCQSFGQTKISPASTSLILCLEAIFSVFFSFLFSLEPLNLRMIAGFALILCGVVVSEILPRWRTVSSPKADQNRLP
ncbi:MAG: DMT family transporter [Clostridia bacterium]|nr:DMT family transporter [Clostridia bacterium]